MENTNNIYTPEAPIQSSSDSNSLTPQKNIYKILFFVFFVLFFIVTSVLITLLINKNKNQISIETSQTKENLPVSPTPIPTISQTIISTESFDKTVECYQNGKYFIAAKHDSELNYFLIKTKINRDTNYGCLYNFEKSDFEIKDAAPVNYYGLENNFLLIDIGTGPGTRGFEIYDLDKKTKIYKGLYGTDQSLIKIIDNTITFWKPTTTKATEENCPNLAENEKNYFNSVIEEHAKLDLITLKEESLKEFRCSPRQ